MGTFCSDRVRKINGYEQPREARLSKHERPKFITPISPCPARPYSHPQERKKGGKTRMKRDKSKIVRWWWWKKDRKRWRNKGLKRWLRVSGVSEVAHTQGLARRSQKKEIISFGAECRLFKFESVLTTGVVTGTGKAPAHLPHSHILINTLKYTHTHWYCTCSPYLFPLTISLSFTFYLIHTSACTYTQTAMPKCAKFSKDYWI